MTASGLAQNVIPILRFVTLPAIVILAVTWWVVLRHSFAFLLPFVLVMAAITVALWLAGFSPLAFFVSLGGYVMFAAVAWIAAAVVREVGGAIRRRS